MATTCSPKKQDVVFLIDGSRSIGEFNYGRLQRFTRRLASRLDLEKGRTHLGLLQAGGRKGSRFQFNIGDFPDRSDIFYMINDMKYLDSTYTYMGEGLKKIREKVKILIYHLLYSSIDYTYTSIPVPRDATNT